MPISPHIVQTLQRDIRQSIGPRVSGLWFEVQDDAQFFFVAELPPQTSDEEVERILSDIQMIVGPQIPPRTKHYSWMAVAKENGKARNVCLSEMLLE